MAGWCDERFAPVREALRENLSLRGELGAAVAVTVDGRAVVDLWCGWTDEARSRPWREDTLVSAFSVGKALAALCVLMLVARGRLALDEPVSRVWPEFAAAGKEAVTVRQVLGHRAGLPAITVQLPDGALYDWERVTAALAAQEPWWTPGAGHGYHVHTFGFLAGELVRRAGGERIASFFRREVAEAVGAELSYGLPGELRPRRADYVFDAALGARAEQIRDQVVDARLRERAYMNPPGAMGLGTVNTLAWQRAELPSANLHGDARGLARVYAALLDETRPLLPAEILEQARAEASAGEDLVLGRPSRFGLGLPAHPA